MVMTPDRPPRPPRPARDRADVQPDPCKEVLEHLPALPESAETVLCTLYHHKPMTGKDLRAATGLPRRTLYTALQRLKEVGVLKEQTSLRDSRQTYFWLEEEAASAENGNNDESAVAAA